ncbi:hypothetical protein HI914_05266 [Erysiphe necator]|nr:hypothetical protein HI914_05266 [Erysiphe necator]
MLFTDSSSEERIVEDADGYEVKILPGNDRLVIDTKCDIVGAFIDHGHIFDRDTRYERCSVLRYPGDFSASFEAPGLSCYDPSSGAPQASHQSPQRSASPPGSPKQTLQRSQQQPVSIPHPESSEQHHERSRSRSRLRQKLRQDSASNYPTESPERHFQQSSKLSPTRSPEREAKFLSDQPVDESRRLSDKLPDWIKVVPPPKPLNIDIFNFKESNKNVK